MAFVAAARLWSRGQAAWGLALVLLASAVSAAVITGLEPLKLRTLHVLAPPSRQVGRAAMLREIAGNTAAFGAGALAAMFYLSAAWSSGWTDLAVGVVVGGLFKISATPLTWASGATHIGASVVAVPVVLWQVRFLQNLPSWAAALSLSFLAAGLMTAIFSVIDYGSFLHQRPQPPDMR